MGRKAIFYVVMSIAIVITAIGLINSTNNFNNANKAVDAKLSELDPALDKLVNVCFDDLRDGVYSVSGCDNKLQETWNGECQQYKDKLSSCSKVEDYLKERALLI